MPLVFTRNPRWRFLTLLGVLTLACRLVTAPFDPTPSPPPTLTELPPTPSATVTATASPTPTPTATPLPPTPTSTATATVSPIPSPTVITPTPLPETLKLSVFEDLWQTVNDNYLYPDFNGLDWDAIYTEYRQRIENGVTNDEFYAAMAEMIYRLGDEHSAFLSPEMVAEEEAEFAGQLDYVGIGVYITAVPERQRAVILAIFPNSPAANAGLQIHDSILAVDGETILDEEGYLRNIVRGPEGSQADFLVQTPGEEPRHITIVRQRITSSLPVPYQVLTSPNGKRVGYILLLSFADSTVDNQVGDALRAMTASAPLDAVILDNRRNEGGADSVLSGTLAYFMSGTLGYFVNREGQYPLNIVRGRDINGSLHVPLVVMVSEETYSFGEVFAGIMKDFKRAYLIGETSLGNVEILWQYEFEDGSRAWIAHDTFCPYHHPDQNWEETGIVPDLTVASEWDLVTTETDPAVLAALEYFDQLP